MATLNVRPETAALLAAELDALDIQFDVDGGTVHLYPTHRRADEVQVRAEAHVWWACCKAAPYGCWWHPRRPS
jgi:hypothetical protein